MICRGRVVAIPTLVIVLALVGAGWAAPAVAGANPAVGKSAGTPFRSSPQELATALQKRFSKLAGSGNHARLTKLFSSLMSSSQSPIGFDVNKQYVPVHMYAARAEIDVAQSFARRRTTSRVDFLPSPTGRRTPDMMSHSTDGTSTPVEVVSITGQRRGKGRIVDFALSKLIDRPSLAIPSPRTLLAPVLSKMRGKRKHGPQLAQKVTTPDGHVILPGGTLVVAVANGGGSAQAGSATVANIRKAVGRMNSAGGRVRARVAGATYIHAIEWHISFGPIVRVERNADGAYIEVSATREELEDEPSADANAGSPIEAARSAAGQAAVRGTGGGSASMFAPPGSGTESAATSLADGLGGVDFSSLELRYLSDVSSADTSATGFAFRARPAGTAGGGEPGTPKRASDAFFVWLALPTSAMWVNLNPSEPDRIIDPRFGRTSTGRVLLEADLRMKKTAARLTNPNTRLGARFWRELEAPSLPSCL